MCIALIVLVWRAFGSDEADAATEKPLSEETTIHPPVAPTSTPDLLQTRFTHSFTDSEIEIAAKTVWGEARGIESRMEQAAVVWCFLNRYDHSGCFGDTLEEVITSPGQFYYDESFKTVDDYGRDITELVRDVIERWEQEKNGQINVGRVLPNDYLWFGGNGNHNYFRNSYESFDNIWDWSFPNPYESEVE